MGLAIDRAHRAFRPSTRAAHLCHTKTYLAFLLYGPPYWSISSLSPSIHGISISKLFIPRVISNYISSLKSQASCYSWEISEFSHHFITQYLRSIGVNHKVSPTPKGAFDLATLFKISQIFSHFSDSQLFRAAFLLAFLPSYACLILPPIQLDHLIHIITHYDRILYLLPQVLTSY